MNLNNFSYLQNYKKESKQTHPDEYFLLRTDQNHVGVDPTLQAAEVALSNLLEILQLVRDSPIDLDVQTRDVNTWRAGHYYSGIKF